MDARSDGDNTQEAGNVAAAVERVTATEAGDRLGALLSRVEYRGERILITRHGRPVAELVPAQAA